jgi:hypothetical protein
MLTIPSPNYSPGRLRPARVVCLHTAQAPCQPGVAAGVMRYLSNDSVDASAHYCTDPTATVAGVDERDTAWAAPGLNADGIQIEQAGYAEFGSGRPIPETNKAARAAYGTMWPGWDAPLMRQMIIEQTVPLVADICRRNGFPAKLLEPADLLAGQRGITDHSRVTAAYGRGDHWDCGGSYPLAEVVAMVSKLLTGGNLGPATTPDPGDEDLMLSAFMLPTGDTVFIHNSATGYVAPLDQFGLTLAAYNELVGLGKAKPFDPSKRMSWEANALLAYMDAPAQFATPRGPRP